MATEAGTTLACMTTAVAYEKPPGEYATERTSGIGATQEGEALTLPLCVNRWKCSRAPLAWYDTQSRRWAPPNVPRRREVGR